MNSFKISSKEPEQPKFESLSDMGKYHLQKSNVPSTSFKLPSLGLNKSDSKGFVLPKLGITPVISNLADFAKNQIDSSEKKNQFMIPKLFSSKTDSVPVDGIKSLQISSDSPQKIVIDLKSALIPEADKKKVPKVIKKENVENFIPQFIDCDFPMNPEEGDLKVDDNCTRVTLKELSFLYKNCSFKRFSMVGKMIGRKFQKKIPKIHHGYEPKNFIESFTFGTPSPDDKILAHLNKNKN